MADDPNDLLKQKVGEWSQWLSEGRLGAVLTSIDALPSSLDPQKPLLRIQMLHRAGLNGQALEAIEALLLVDHNPDAITLVNLARISSVAGEGLLAARLLDRAVENLDTSEGLEIALATAGNIDDHALEARIARCVEKLFPDSAVLKSRRVRAYVDAGDYRSASAALADEPDVNGISELYALLSDALRGSDVPAYTTIRRSLVDRRPAWASQVNMALVRDALRRGLVVHAFDLAIPDSPSAKMSRFEVRLVLDVIERILLYRDNRSQLAFEAERLKAPSPKWSAIYRTTLTTRSFASALHGYCPLM